MKKNLIVIVLSVISWTIIAQPLPQKNIHHIVIDTDGAIDDFRAIAIMLSRPEFDIRSILLSDGTLTPGQTLPKISSLLFAMGKDSIPVGTGIIKGMNPPWRSFNQSIEWSQNTQHIVRVTDAITLLKKQLETATEKIIVVCMGGLTHIALAIQNNPGYREKIERVIWYNESVAPLQGFNYDCDPKAAEYLLHSGVRVDVISNLNEKEALIDDDLLNRFLDSSTPLALVINRVFSQSAVSKKMREKHFLICDDLIPVYINNPELFDMNVDTRNMRVRFNPGYNALAVKEVIIDMIKGTYVTEKNIIFNEFPKNSDAFAYDIRGIIDSVIALYGIQEWKANVMTDEFHGHLGVFSIVGAKMGIRAREILNIGPDELEVITFAGNRPPYSCLNDGIQVSTGATLGMGTIHLSGENIFVPSALFIHHNDSIRITLKPEYLKLVNDDIAEGILKFGLMDDGYWKLVRRNAIKYWLEWDRKVIFDVQVISLNKS